MGFERERESFVDWLDTHMMKGGGDVPARLVTVMGLLERLHEISNLTIDDHLKEGKQQLVEHNKYVAQALAKFEIDSPVKEFGRRSSNLGGWIGPLFDWLKAFKFASLSGSEKAGLLNAIQAVAADRLQVINQGKPLIARYNKGTARAVVADILDQAQEKKRAKDVAEYLVGAKLQLRFGEDAATPKNVNTPNRDRPADFHVGGAAIEVTVNPADARHISQIGAILNDTGLDVWLLVRLRDREKWQNVIDATFEESLIGRVVVADIETFVAQNVAEIAEFERPKVAHTLAELFEIYNSRWLPEAGASGLRIVTVDPQHE